MAPVYGQNSHEFCYTDGHAFPAVCNVGKPLNSILPPATGAPMTSSRSQRPNDPHELEHWVHRTLVAGLAVSATLLLVGIAAMLAKGERHAPAHVSVSELLRDSAVLSGPALVTLGLLALMVTPILRVIVLLLGWSYRRDWLFASVASAVLALLILSLSLGVG